MAVNILVGDVRQRLAEMPDSSVHCIVTSPPFWGLRDYGVPGQLGLEPTYQEYVDNLVAAFRQAWRVLRPDGVMFVNLGDCYATGAGKAKQAGGGMQGARWEGMGPSVYRSNQVRSGRPRAGVPDSKNPMAGIPTSQPNRMPQSALKPKDLVGIPWRVAFGLQDDGWYLRSDIIWHKPNAMPESVTDRPTSAHEHMFLLAKSTRYFFDSEAVKEPCASGPSDIKKMIEGLPRIGVKHKTLDDPLNRASAATNMGRKRAVGNLSGRNLRNVWTIATAHYSGRHFATFPPALVEPCIKAGTSEYGCCSSCGAPYQRIIGKPVAALGRGSGNVARKFAAKGERSRTNTHLGSSVPWQPSTVSTVGWTPTCACDAGDPIPATVLDPFLGAGTVGLVASRLGREAIGIELSPDYARMGADRIREEGFPVAIVTARRKAA